MSGLQQTSDLALMWTILYHHLLVSSSSRIHSVVPGPVVDRTGRYKRAMVKRPTVVTWLDFWSYVDVDLILSVGGSRDKSCVHTGKWKEALHSQISPTAIGRQRQCP